MKEYLSQTLKRSSSLLASLMLVFQMTLPLSAFAAAAGPSTPVSGDGIVPALYTADQTHDGGNVSCAQLGFSLGSTRNNYDNNNNVFADSWPSGLSVTVTNDKFVSWTSTFGIGAVVVKGSNSSNVYSYTPADMGDSGLASPVAGQSGNPADLSNLTFCWNEPETGSITIKKNAIPDSDQVFHFSTTGLSTDGAGFDLVDDSTTGLPEKVFNDLSAGSYTVSEDTVNDWDFDSVTCSPSTNVVKNGSSVTINLAAGEDVVCTFTNREAPEVDYCDPTQRPAGQSIAQWLANNQIDGSDCFDYAATQRCGYLDVQFTENLTPYAYEFRYVIGDSTPALANWQGDGVLPVSFTEDENGGSVTVTYYVVGPEKDYFVGFGIPNIWDGNGVTVQVDTDCEEPQGSITIVKDVTGTDEQDFEFEFDAGQRGGGFTLDDDGDNSNSHSNTEVISPLDAGQYIITEVNIPDGWELDDIDCEGDELSAIVKDEDNNKVTVDLAAGEHITCTFTNDKDEGGGGGPTKGRITGHKVEDKDGDQQWDQDEEALPGWTINLYSCMELPNLLSLNAQVSQDPTCDNATLIDTTVTDENGAFSFDNLDLGTYMVCEVQQAGWEQTFPSGDGCHIIEVNSSEPCIANFGNKQKPGQVLGEETPPVPQVLATTGTPLLQGLLVGLTILGFAGATSYFTIRKQYNY